MNTPQPACQAKDTPLNKPSLGLLLVTAVAAVAGHPAIAGGSAALAPAVPLPPEAFSQKGTLIDFETGDFSQAVTLEGADRAIITCDEGPVREGDYAYRASLKSGVRRTEVVGARSDAYGVARYGWSIYVPEAFDADTWFSIVSQWHDWGTGRPTPADGGAPTHLYIAQGKWQFRLRYQDDSEYVPRGKVFVLDEVQADRGRWTDWVLEINWQPPGKGGWMKLYKNDTLVIDYQGTTFFDEKDRGPYFKWGIYKGRDGWLGTEEGAVLYFDSFRMQTGSDGSWRDVAPSTYSPRQEQ